MEGQRGKGSRDVPKFAGVVRGKETQVQNAKRTISIAAFIPVLVTRIEPARTSQSNLLESNIPGPKSMLRSVTFKLLNMEFLMALGKVSSPSKYAKTTIS